tara:strand:- start:2117 stop:2230 length:114 start_codon:yes stop_codon:yes gene_type:complete
MQGKKRDRKHKMKSIADQVEKMEVEKTANITEEKKKK